MRWSKLLFPVCLASLLAFPAASGGERVVSLGDFEEDGEGWVFYGGWEFPGAGGGIQFDGMAKSGKRSLKLWGDFSKGGAYVAANKSFNPPVDMKELRFWIKADGVKELGLRINDATDQCFQHKIPLNDTPEWQQVSLKEFEKAAGSWGGANDKKFHQPAKSVSLLIGAGPDRKSSVLIDSVEALSKGLDEPWSAAKDAPPPSPPLTLNCASELGVPKWKSVAHLSQAPDFLLKTSLLPAALDGKGVMALDVPNPHIVGECVAYPLDKSEDGNLWDSRKYDCMSFLYKTDDTEGEAYIGLKGPGGLYNARFAVRKGGWHKVTLPFSAFFSTAYTPRPPYKFLQSCKGVNEVQLATGAQGTGTDGNSLKSPGRILFADFKVDSFESGQAIRKTSFAPINLAGAWKMAPALGDDTWAKEGFDDSKWAQARAEAKWSQEGLESVGAACFRTQVFIPKEWEGVPLLLRSTSIAKGAAWWNGNSLEGGAQGRPSKGLLARMSEWWDGAPQESPKAQVPLMQTYLVPPAAIRYGEVNTLALRIERDGSLKAAEPSILGETSVEPELLSLALRPSGGTPEQERPPERFDMGAQPPDSLELVFRFPKRLAKDGATLVEYSVTDFNFRPLASGETAASLGPDGLLRAVVRLDREQARQLYYSEYFEYVAALKDGAGRTLMAGSARIIDLCYAGRDAKALPALPEKFEDTDYGRLKLIDEIDCSIDTAKDEHPYKEGALNWSRWCGRKYYYWWQDSVRVEDVLGRKCRVASNTGWFGYRIGRGLKPGQTYVLRVEYPEDKPRYAPMDIQLGKNHSCPGWRTGVRPDDPFDNFPLSGNYEFYDNIIAPEELGYGSRGARSVSSVNGIWVNFIDVNGHARAYGKAQYAGPAVSRIKLYEIDSVRNAPKIALPEGLPHRILMEDWEREPEFDPASAAKIAKLMGLNAISPEILKWSFTAYWPTKLGYEQQDPLIPFKPLAPGRRMNTLEDFLKATKEAGVGFMPRIEYGGSKTLPLEAYAKKPDGKNAPVGRYASWGANLLHPATWEEFSALLDETVGAWKDEYPQVMGMFWRMRCDRMVMSQGPKDVEMYKKETGDKDLSGYEAWWHKKRLEFHERIRDKLRSMRPDMKFCYYNWDPDGWHLGGVTPRSHAEWAALYDNERKLQWYDVELAHYAKFKNADFVKMVQGMRPPHTSPDMELYKGVDGIAFFAPVCLRYVADNPEYLDFFRTGDGLAVCHQVLYEETNAYYCQRTNFEGSMITPAGPSFAMAPELWAWFHGDANVLSFATYNYGRGFAAAHRRFAQAFLALPDIKGEMLKDAVKPASEDVRARKYAAKGRVYLGVANKGYAGLKFELSVPGEWKGTEKVLDLVSGRETPCKHGNGAILFEVDSAPMQLNSFLIK